MVFVIGAAVVAVAASTVAWIYDAKTEEEKRKHLELKEKRYQYKAKYENLSNKHNQEIERLKTH